jgi:hypothetical protein
MRQPDAMVVRHVGVYQDGASDAFLSRASVPSSPIRLCWRVFLTEQAARRVHQMKTSARRSGADIRHRPPAFVAYGDMQPSDLMKIKINLRLQLPL